MLRNKGFQVIVGAIVITGVIIAWLMLGGEAPSNNPVQKESSGANAKVRNSTLAREVDGKKVYDIAFGLQFICLSDNIDTAIAKAIIDKRDEYGMDTISGVVFKDAGFKGNDSEKLNCIQLLKDAGFIEENLQTI